MRKYILLLILASLFVTKDALAEDRFGYYGYGHHDREVHKATNELMRKTGEKCCDGETGPDGMIRSGGECRVTKTDMLVTRVWIDGQWCPIQHDTALRSDIPLPDKVQAIACAAKQEKVQQNAACPKIYCLAAKFGS